MRVRRFLFALFLSSFYSKLYQKHGIKTNFHLTHNFFKAQNDAVVGNLFFHKNLIHTVEKTIAIDYQLIVQIIHIVWKTCACQTSK
ncbi:MAG: hypothetical protein RL757_1334 [Bacteroidota bacterium]|jgi:hypothetical protein